MIRFILNEKEVATALPPGMVLLDFIRYHQHLLGTKIGCREGDCGACAILVGQVKEGGLTYQSVTSCLMPLGNAHGKHIVTIEGINFPEGLNPVQQFMAEEGATQCGFCTPGFVVSMAGFCLSEKEATRENAIAAIDGNICRCTGYKSIERAVTKLTGLLKDKNGGPIQFVTQQKILPRYFSSIEARLQNLENGVLSPDNLPKLTSLVAGGTDLYVQKHEELVNAAIHFAFDDPHLKGIRRDGNNCIIGPSATVTDLLESPLIKEAFPYFPWYAKLVSSTPIRNMATIAGNFINASPIGDLTILFLALNAKISLVINEGESKPRDISLRKFYKGYKELDMQPGEMVNQISFELPGKETYFNFEKVSKRTHLDIASVNTAICLNIRNGLIAEAGIAAGGVAPIPLFLEKTSAVLQGRAVTGELLEEAITMMQSEISPISDTRGTKEYKTVLLGQLIRAHFYKLDQMNV